MAPAKPKATDPRTSRVLQVPAAEPAEAEAHFLRQLSFETDPSDVHDDLAKGVRGFAVLDCRPAGDYAAGHVPTAVSAPYASLDPEAGLRLDPALTYVVYDSGLFDNAATKTCLRLATLGVRVKEMQGGLHGWTGEGYPVATGTAPGKLAAKPELARLK